MSGKQRAGQARRCSGSGSSTPEAALPKAVKFPPNLTGRLPLARLELPAYHPDALQPGRAVILHGPPAASAAGDVPRRLISLLFWSLLLLPYLQGLCQSLTSSGLLSLHHSYTHCDAVPTIMMGS